METPKFDPIRFFKIIATQHIQTRNEIEKAIDKDAIRSLFLKKFQEFINDPNIIINIQNALKTLENFRRFDKETVDEINKVKEFLKTDKKAEEKLKLFYEELKKVLEESFQPKPKIAEFLKLLKPPQEMDKRTTADEWGYVRRPTAIWPPMYGGNPNDHYDEEYDKKILNSMLEGIAYDQNNPLKQREAMMVLRDVTTSLTFGQQEETVSFAHWLFDQNLKMSLNKILELDPAHFNILFKIGGKTYTLLSVLIGISNNNNDEYANMLIRKFFEIKEKTPSLKFNNAALMAIYDLKKDDEFFKQILEKYSQELLVVCLENQEDNIIPLLEFLIARGADVKECIIREEPCLFFIIERFLQDDNDRSDLDFEVIKFLITSGVELSKKNNSNRDTAFSTACCCKSTPEKLKKLLDYFFSLPKMVVGSSDEIKKHGFLRACELEYAESLEYFKTTDATKGLFFGEELGGINNVALLVSTYQEKISIVDYLLRTRTELYPIEINKYVDYSFESEHLVTLDQLDTLEQLKNMFSGRRSPINALIIATMKKNVPMVRRLLDSGADCNNLQDSAFKIVEKFLIDKYKSFKERQKYQTYSDYDHNLNRKKDQAEEDYILILEMFSENSKTDLSNIFKNYEFFTGKYFKAVRTVSEEKTSLEKGLGTADAIVDGFACMLIATLFVTVVVPISHILISLFAPEDIRQGVHLRVNETTIKTIVEGINNFSYLIFSKSSGNVDRVYADYEPVGTNVLNAITKIKTKKPKRLVPFRGGRSYLKKTKKNNKKTKKNKRRTKTIKLIKV